MASPTVLLGDQTAPTISSASTVVKFPVLPIVAAALAGTVFAILGFGGIGYYLVHTGRLVMAGGAAPKVPGIVQVTTHAMSLEPLLVNLADADGKGYLRVSLTLRVSNAVDTNGARMKSEKRKDDSISDESVAEVRDTVLNVLGRQTADQLLTSEGKEHLKAQLKAGLAEHNADLKVTEIFFTDFLVQR